VRKSAIILLLIFTLSSCCTTRICKIERAEKKISKLTQKYPELLAKDTIVLKDTITISDINADTTFLDNTTDTIVITKDKLTIKYIKQDSLIYLMGNCEGDTVYITNEVLVDKVVVRELTWREKAKEYTYLMLALAALLLVVRIFFKSAFRIFKL
tara:strand:+ start:24 stop:488 length:465 start_codon:yes stop_codon:yes gene_type:complete